MASTLLLFVLGAGLASAEPDEPAGDAPAREAAALAQEILGDRRFQTELPSGDEPLRLSLPLADSLGPLALLLLYALVAMLAVLVAVGIVLEISRWRSRSVPGAERTTGVVGVEEGALPSARTLAEAGRYAEAVHALLLVAIRRLGSRHAVRLAPSLTSREVLRLLPLDGAPREALGELVAAVERSRFGGGTVGRGDWAGCLERFRAAVGEEPA